MKVQNEAEMERNGGKLNFVKIIHTCCLSLPENPPSIWVERLPLLWSKGGKNQFSTHNSSNIGLNENIQENKIKVHKISYKNCVQHFCPVSHTNATKWCQNWPPSTRDCVHYADLTTFASIWQGVLYVATTNTRSLTVTWKSRQIIESVGVEFKLPWRFTRVITDILCIFCTSNSFGIMACNRKCIFWDVSDEV